MQEKDSPLYRIKKLQKRLGKAAHSLVALLVIVLVLSACAAPPPVAPPSGERSLDAPTATPQATATPAPTATPTAEPAPENAPGDDGSRSGGDTMRNGAPAELIERAKAEVASLARSAAESVQVKSVEQVEWSDASLGCPQGGMMYAQVITPGYKIVLESGGRTYEFHSGMDPAGPLVRCDSR